MVVEGVNLWALLPHYVHAHCTGTALAASCAARPQPLPRSLGSHTWPRPAAWQSHEAAARKAPEAMPGGLLHPREAGRAHSQACPAGVLWPPSAGMLRPQRPAFPPSGLGVDCWQPVTAAQWKKGFPRPGLLAGQPGRAHRRSGQETRVGLPAPLLT